MGPGASGQGFQGMQPGMRGLQGNPAMRGSMGMQSGIPPYSPSITGPNGDIVNRVTGNPTFGSIPPYQSQIPNAIGQMVDRVTGSPPGVPFGSDAVGNAMPTGGYMDSSQSSGMQSMTPPPSGGGLLMNPTPSTYNVPPPSNFPQQAQLPQSMQPQTMAPQAPQQDFGNWLNDYRTKQGDGFTGTRGGMNYINGNLYAAEGLSQGTDPNTPDFAFQNILNQYAPQIGQLTGAQMGNGGANPMNFGANPGAAARYQNAAYAPDPNAIARGAPNIRGQGLLGQFGIARGPGVYNMRGR